MIPLLTSLFGCGAAGQDSAAAGTVPKNSIIPADPSFPITWQLAQEGEVLVLQYKIQNLSESDVWLLDVPHVPVVAGYEPQPSRVTILTEGSLVRFVRGHLRPPAGQGIAMEYTPVARRLAAGATLSGEAKVDLPIRPWHPYYRQVAYNGTPRGATFELGLLVGDPPEGVDRWDTRFSTDTTGSPIHVPTLGFVAQRQQFVGSTRIPLP